VPAIAQVEPLTTARALRGPFDYVAPAELGLDVGSLLVVPFGGRDVLGVVMAMAEHSSVPRERLRAPRRVLEADLPEDLVELAGWIADECCSTPARALSLVLPPGAARGARTLTRLVAELTCAGRAALPAGAGVRLGPRQRAVLERLEREGPQPATAVGIDHGSLRRLAGRGLIELAPRRSARRPHHHTVGVRRATPPPLTAAQREALEPVRAALSAGDPERLLLHGVTGSGKTEVYLQAAATALEHGRSVIVLVPEIALTPQLTSRFVERFGEVVAILHSRLGAGERYDEWRRLRDGQARVCVGPRSAVFAPLSDLGLVIVDEEHESSYKHEGDPRYDARWVAEHRAARHGAVLLAGSATPRPESVHRLRRLRLPARVHGEALPAVRILDMREARSALHPQTAEALAEVRRRRGKAIVLLNRRGWSNFLSCRSCGRTWGCPQCDVTLVLHRAQNLVACHHCGYREPTPTRCPDCGSVSVARHGTGTERLEHELSAALDDGHFPVLRLDGDALGGEGPGAVLARFGAAPAGVLLGTQMVAKGHDFAGVTLGIVLDADATLRFPDFRAEERTFALVAQLAGRAGRVAGEDARVLVQTLAPEADCILHAARHDADGFLENELRRREQLRYPPFSHLIRIVCAAEHEPVAAGAAGAIRAALDAPGAIVLGPAPLFRLRGQERRQIVLKASRRREAIDAVRQAVAAVRAERSHRAASISVDVDPQ
jgi:primosomal protein N' (replication factor Y)